MSQLGKNANYSVSGSKQARGGNCTLGCSMGCTYSAISLCKCRNGQSAYKGSTYYPERNVYIRTSREPVTG